MKLAFICLPRKCHASLPVRGAWIEIFHLGFTAQGEIMSLPVRGAWIEIQQYRTIFVGGMSLPVRGAWIEIS